MSNPDKECRKCGRGLRGAKSKSAGLCHVCINENTGLAQRTEAAKDLRNKLKAGLQQAAGNSASQTRPLPTMPPAMSGRVGRDEVENTIAWDDGYVDAAEKIKTDEPLTMDIYERCDNDPSYDAGVGAAFYDDENNNLYSAKLSHTPPGDRQPMGPSVDEQASLNAGYAVRGWTPSGRPTRDADAQTILNQIGAGARMNLGAREYVDLGDGIRFTIGRGSRRKVEIQLASDDTYSARIVRMKNVTYQPVTEWSQDNLYAEDLSEALIRAHDQVT